MSKPRLSLLFFAVLAASTAVLVTMVALLSWFYVGPSDAAVWPSLVVALAGVGVALSIIAIVHLSLVASRRAKEAGRERTLAGWTQAWSDVANGLPLPLVPASEVQYASEAAARVLQVVSGDAANRVRRALESRGVTTSEQSVALHGLRAATPESTAALERLAWIASTSSIPLFEVAVTGTGRASRAGLLGLMRVLAAQSRPDDVGPSVVAAVEEHVNAASVPEGVRPFLTAVFAEAGDHVGWLCRTLLSSSRHEAVRVAALDAIGGSRRTEAIDQAVGSIVSGAHGETLAAALRVLSHFGHVPDAASQIVVSSAEVGEGIAVRVNATYALLGLDAKVAVPVLWRLLADGAWELRRAAAEALVRLGALGVDVLKRAAATHHDRFARDVAMMALATPAVSALRDDERPPATTRSPGSGGTAGATRVEGDLDQRLGALRLARGQA